MMSGAQSLLLTALLCFTICAVIQSYPTGDDSTKVVKYQDLEALNASCDPLDTCRTNRWSADTLEWYNCMCGHSCVHLDTCCVDSPFSSTRHECSTTPKCLKVYGGEAFYMVDSCSSGWSDDGLVEDMCKSSGEETSDPFLTIPVTSLKTGISYKNYFCSVCSEEQDIEGNLSFWSIKMSNEDEWEGRSGNLPEIFYNDTHEAWMMVSDKNGGLKPVTITIQVPPGLRHLVYKCNPNLISTCSANWTDEGLARKCSAYMAKVLFTNEDMVDVWYRNPHCAICNHEDAPERSCAATMVRLKPGGVKDVLFVGLFVLEDRKKKCSKDMVYDAFFKKCRIAKCSKGKVFKDGKCVLRDD